MGAAAVRAALRAYTYPYRKRFASLSRSVALKNRPYLPPKGFAFVRERYGGVPVEKVTPPNAKAGAVLQFHGGGHTAPMNDMYRKAAKLLAANCGCTVYSIDYRTGASLVYPAVHDECCRGYAALCETALADGNFVAVGDSFGANLLLSSCLRAREDGLPLPSALVCICSFLDMAAGGDSYRENAYKDPLYAMPKRFAFEKYEKNIRRISPYCGDTPLTNPFLSPAYADFHKFPKTLIQAGSLETSLSDSRMLYDGFLRAGVCAELHVFPGMWHDFMYMFPGLKESKSAWQEVFRFITANLRSGRKPDEQSGEGCTCAPMESGADGGK